MDEEVQQLVDVAGHPRENSDAAGLDDVLDATLHTAADQGLYPLIAQQSDSIEGVLAVKVEVRVASHSPPLDVEDGDGGRVLEARRNTLSEAGNRDSHGVEGSAWG